MNSHGARSVLALALLTSTIFALPPAFAVQPAKSAGQQGRVQEGIFSFVLPSGFTKIVDPELSQLRDQGLCGGRKLAEESGTADPSSFTPSNLSFFAAYRDSVRGIILYLMGDDGQPNPGRDAMFALNTQRIDWGKAQGYLSQKSKGTSKLEVAKTPAIEMDIVDSSGARMRTYSFFLNTYPAYSFEVALAWEKEGGEADDVLCQELLSSLQIKAPEPAVPKDKNTKKAE